MKRLLALVLSFTLLLSGCSTQQTAVATQSDEVIVSESSSSTADDSETASEETVSSEPTDISESETVQDSYELEFTGLSDADLLRYIEDSLYTSLIEELNSDQYFIDNVSSVYISNEYLEEVAYNSKSNIYFGYSLEELEEEFQGTHYIFTLGEDGTTTVEAFEDYDDTYDQILRNVAIGSGVILVCVTVSVVSGGVGAPAAVTVIFAASAKSSAIFAASSAAFSGVASGIITGIQTQDFDEAIKAAALGASEGFKWGAISGAILGGVGEAVALHGATLNGLTMSEAAIIQQESGYPLDIIAEFHSLEEYYVYKEAGLQTVMVNGKLALVQNIDLEYLSELSDGTVVTNLERMKLGYAPLDPETGLAYQLHHIGLSSDGTLAILTASQHQDNAAILNIFSKSSEINRTEFASTRQAFWKYMGEVVFANGGI